MPGELVRLLATAKTFLASAKLLEGLLTINTYNTVGELWVMCPYTLEAYSAIFKGNDI